MKDSRWRDGDVDWTLTFLGFKFICRLSVDSFSIKGMVIYLMLFFYIYFVLFFFFLLNLLSIKFYVLYANLQALLIFVWC